MLNTGFKVLVTWHVNNKTGLNLSGQKFLTNTGGNICITGEKILKIDCAPRYVLVATELCKKIVKCHMDLVWKAI